MAAITAAMVKELRESTGAGMMECKKALTETDGDMEAAVDVLRKSGAAKVEKKTLIHLKSFFYFFRKNRFKIKSEAQHLTSAPQREKETFQLQPKVVPSK